MKKDTQHKILSKNDLKEMITFNDLHCFVARIHRLR